MALFGNLFSQKGPKSAHPLGSDENVAALLAEMPVSDPARALQETGEWLDDFSRFADEVASPALLNAALQLDEAAEPARIALLERYFDPRHREHLSEVTWADIERSLRQSIGAYHHCLKAAASPGRKDAPPERQHMLLACVRALRAWGSRAKLLRFRYRGPESADWRELHEILALAGTLGVAGEAVVAYPEGADKLSPLHQYLVAVYLQLAPLTNLAPEQIEALDRLLLGNAALLDLLTAANAASSHKIDLGGAGGPIPADKPTAGGSEWRYLSRSRLRPLVTKVAVGLRTSPAVPPDLASSGLTLDALKSLLRTLMLYWAEEPPHRAKDRRPGHEALRAVIGFGLARRMIAFSDFARSGRSIEYDGNNIDALFEQTRFGGRASLDEMAPEIVVEKAVVSPLVVLEKLELAGDKQMMEAWTLADQSETGMGVTATGLKPRYQIGSLVCLRYDDGIEWHLGIIRRIGRDAAGRASIGLETLAWPSSSVHVKPADENATAWTSIEEAGHGYLDAILVTSDSNQIVLPVGAFVADIRLVMRSGDSRRTIQLTELVERGEDFDVVRFAPAD